MSTFLTGRPRRSFAGVRAALAGLVLLAAASSHAASLQVAPTSVQLGPTQNAEALWISNSGAAPVDVQARIYRWAQQEGRDTLEPTTDLVVSPPMQSLPAGQQQLIRVVRTTPEAPPGQLTYRIIVDEVPTLDPGRQGMQFVLRYSVPVFVQPATGTALAPDLQARVSTGEDGKVTLEVHNRGTSYAQLADLATGPLDKPQVFQPGLLGYVLSGQTMRWPLEITAARLQGGTLSAKINGESVATPLSPPPPSR